MLCVGTRKTVTIGRCNLFQCNLFKIRYLLYLSLHCLAIHMPFGVMSGNLTFIFDNPIICKLVKYIDHSDNSFYRVPGLRFKTLIADWSVENMNMTECRWMLYRQQKHIKHDTSRIVDWLYSDIVIAENNSSL